MIQLRQAKSCDFGDFPFGCVCVSIVLVLMLQMGLMLEVAKVINIYNGGCVYKFLYSISLSL